MGKSTLVKVIRGSVAEVETVFGIGDGYGYGDGSGYGYGSGNGYGYGNGNGDGYGYGNGYGGGEDLSKPDPKRTTLGKLVFRKVRI